MNDEQELQRDLDLIRSVADRGVMQIEAARRELEALLSRQVLPPTASAPERPAAAPSTDLEEDDFYQFGGFDVGAVTPGAGGGDALELDTDDVRRVAQELKGLGDQLMPALAAAMDGAGPERSVAAVAKVTTSGDQFSTLCGNYLRESGEQLERVVQAFLAVEEHNAAAITSVDPRSL